MTAKAAILAFAEPVEAEPPASSLMRRLLDTHSAHVKARAEHDAADAACSAADCLSGELAARHEALMWAEERLARAISDHLLAVSSHLIAGQS